MKKRKNINFEMFMYTVFFVMFIFTFIGVRFEWERQLVTSMGLVLLTSGLMTSINSQKYDKQGRVFQIKKDYKIFEFIQYNERIYKGLPIVYLWMTINFLISGILLWIVVIISELDLYPVLFFILGSVIIEFIFAITEVFIFKTKEKKK